MRIKATDSDGKTHWLSERPNDNFVWATESQASVMPVTRAIHWVEELQRRNRYLDREDQMELEIDRSIT